MSGWQFNAAPQEAPTAPRSPSGVSSPATASNGATAVRSEPERHQGGGRVPLGGFDGVARLTERQREMVLAEGRDQGRADAAAWWPAIHDEGFAHGYARARHDILTRLRARARQDPVARTLLAQLLTHD